MTSRRRSAIAAAFVSALAISVSSCGSNGSSDAKTVTIVAYDSFTPSKEVLAEFTKQTGIATEIVTAGDTGELVNRAVLTKEKPLGDVLYGVDTTFVSRALDNDLFQPYESPELKSLSTEFVTNTFDGRVTPVDYGDVCINVDTAALAKAGVEAPETLDDLTKPAYKDMLVVQNPATSSPGLTFLLGSAASFGADGWQPWWTQLKANGVKVVNGWEEAWNTEFSGGPGAGDRPLVVSYASSPPAVVLFGDNPAATESPVAAIADTCIRQVEYAGILDNAQHRGNAQKLIDFLIGAEFQSDLALNMFVFPVRSGVTLPEAFTRFAVVPPSPIVLDSKTIDTNREKWIDEWTSLVLG
jgi:thiamine transport system substrate-binding protein